MLRWFPLLSRAGTFERLAYALTVADREQAGREASSITAVLDTQAAHSGEVGVAGRRGHDSAQRVVECKRHALTDANGPLLMAGLSPANPHDATPSSTAGFFVLAAAMVLVRCLARAF